MQSEKRFQSCYLKEQSEPETSIFNSSRTASQAEIMDNLK